MTIEMTLQMVFDDLLDVENRVPRDIRVAILDQTLSSFGALGTRAEVQIDPHVDGFWHEVLSGLSVLQCWRNTLMLGLDVDTGPDSLSQQLYSTFIDTYYHVHDGFEDLEAYLVHRVHNCGMPLQAYWAAHWYCRVVGVDIAMLEKCRTEVGDLLRRYGVLAGLNNDIVGYDKDILEGVATSVEILVRMYAGRENDRDEQNRDAFRTAIDRHNQLLEELRLSIVGSEFGSVQYVVLLSILRTVWSVHILHGRYLDVYRPGSLQRAMAARNED